MAVHKEAVQAHAVAAVPAADLPTVEVHLTAVHPTAVALLTAELPTEPAALSPVDQAAVALQDPDSHPAAPAHTAVTAAADLPAQEDADSIQQIRVFRRFPERVSGISSQ